MSALKRKIEKGLVDYLASKAELAIITVQSGSENNEAETPWLSVFASNESQDSSLPAEAGVKLVNVRMQYQANVNDTTRSEVDTVVEEIGYFTEDLAGIQAAINKQADPDTRDTLGVHVYYVSLDSHSTDFDDDMWVEEIEISVTCGQHDAL